MRMFKGILDWLFGRSRNAAQRPAPTAEPADFERLNRNAPLRDTTLREDVPSGVGTFLCREAVLGRDQRIAGYQFMLQESTRNRIQLSSRRIHHLYAEVLVRSLVGANIAQLLGHRRAFLEVPDSFLGHPCLDELPAAQVVLIAAPHHEQGCVPPETLRPVVEALKRRGFGFALPDPLVIREYGPLLTLADMIVVRAPALDARHGLQLTGLLSEGAPNAHLLVRDLPSLEDFRFAFKMGAALFQGPFITSREDWSEHELGPDALRIATLIGRLRQNAETRELAALLKEDGALSLRLLRYVNSAANALPTPVSSIEHALAMIGHERLHRWLVLLACSTDGRNARAASALETALIRARLMELLGHDCPQLKADALFLVGLLSLADVIMQVPLDKVLAPLALDPDIEAALRHGEGPLFPLLELAIACENGDTDPARLHDLAEARGISAQQASDCHLKAMLWAIELNI